MAEDFALWLNARLRKSMPDVGAVEKREWETRERLRSNLREMEKLSRGAEMSSLILLRRVRVENANAIAGLTWGFLQSPIFWDLPMRCRAG